jgi:hypothetical protein
MKATAYPVRSAMSAFAFFLHECSLDRTRDNLPLRELMDSRSLEAFQSSCEQMMSALLMDYTLERRSQQAREHLRRCHRCGSH